MGYEYDFSTEKNSKLKAERNISFEEVIFVILDEGILDILEHPNQNKYPNQKLFVVSIDNYAYLIPVIINEEKIFLKTIIPSRKATRDYLRGKKK